MISQFGVISYAISGLAFLLLVLLLLLGWRGRPEGVALIIAATMQVLWSILLSAQAYHELIGNEWLFFIEFLRVSAWLVFFMRLLTLGEYRRLSAYFSLPIVVTLVAGFLFSVLRLFFDGIFTDSDSISFFLLLMLAIFGLLLSEQLYRNIRPEKRWAIRFLCIGLGAIFVYDIYMYSDAFMHSRNDNLLWDSRGVVNALVVPLIALSAARNPKWSFDIFVSRQVVFYTTGLLSIGVYLLLIAIGGFYIQHYGGNWGYVLQIMFLMGAVVLLFVVLSSARTRSRIKIFITKHFYKNKYDYREEWLKLTHKISEYKSTEYFYEQVIQAVAELLQCTGGHLFVVDGDAYRCVMSWNGPNLNHDILLQHSLPVFLNKHDWIIDIKEYAREHENYEGLRLPEWLNDESDYWLIIPLKHQYRLLGFMLLQKSLAHDSINWEDRDLLKAVGRQISSYLALIRTSEELNEAQQFSAFNKLSAFVVHDLKNQVAQLALLVKNAEKYREDPRFIADAMLTVENVVTRMQKLLSQLRRMRFDAADRSIVNVRSAVINAIEKCANSLPKPQLLSADADLHVYAEPERLANVLQHLIQNAQDATEDEGYIRIEVAQEDGVVAIRISDNGVGMTDTFVRDRLFKPFDTTKGNAGMGVGVFEAREFARLHDGNVTVHSKPGEGSVFVLKLPQFVEG